MGLILDNPIIASKSNKKQAQVRPFDWGSVPTLHWCGHYLDSKGIAIPDGVDCCWRHWIGLPQRWGQRHPYYSWQEKQIIPEFFVYQYFWMKKPPKIGASETYLHLAMHQACINTEWKHGQVAIVVGTTGLKEGEEMISRCKEALKAKGIPIDEGYNTKTEFTLNGVKFRAHPADNVDAVRSKPNMRFILVDEGAFFKQNDQQVVRAAFEHYIGGSGTKIALVSTAGEAPEGFMYDIEKEPDVTQGGVYRHYDLANYKVGLEVHPESKTSLFNAELIEQAQKLPSFQRNFMGMWGHGAGDIFSLKAVEEISKTHYKIEIPNPGRTRVLNVDPAYGSSKSALVGGELIGKKKRIIQAEQITRPSQTELIDKINQSIKLYGYTVLQVDSAHPGLMEEFRGRMHVNPINFREKGQLMTDSASREVNNLDVEVHPDMVELIQQLKAARKNEKGTVDKKIASFDLYDGFIMDIDYFSHSKIVWADLGKG